MTLHEFLLRNKESILHLSERKTIELAALRPLSDELQRGLPLFFDQLILVLSKNKSLVAVPDERNISITAGALGKEYLRLGYTLTHVVHAYGAICQAITEMANQSLKSITALEFHNLNRCLDIAIAGAVTEFESIRSTQSKAKEVEHLGALAHELRNALNRAIISSEMMTKGIVGVSGSTAQVLHRSLIEMNGLLDRSLSAIKLRAQSENDEEVFSVIEVISQLLVTAEVEAGYKLQTLSSCIDTSLEIKADKHLFLSAMGNIIQNAIKYSKTQGKIQIIGKTLKDSVLIEVQDECGGIPPEKIQEMFEPFEQISQDKSGLGLGLSIVRKAIDRCGGTVTAENFEGGCSFKVIIPKAEIPEAPPRIAV